MDQKNITFAITVLVVILASVFLGSAVGQNNQTVAISAIAVIVVCVLLASMGQRIWVLIPIFATWTQKSPVLPLPFSLANLTVLLAFSVWALGVAVRRSDWSFRLNRFDFVLALTLALLAVGYFRNPVSIQALASGGDVGGRPYAEVVIAVMAYVVLSGMNSHAKLVESIPKWIIISSSVLAVGGAIAVFIPQAGVFLYQFYAGFKPDMRDFMDPYAIQSGIGKAGYVRPLAFALTAFVGAKCHPVKLLQPQNFWLVCLLMLGGVLGALTGFRSALIAVGFYLVAASWFWMRSAGVILCGFAGICFTLLLISFQSIVPLPQKVQRSLSFLPGDWDSRVVAEGQGTLDWRLDLWETVLYGDNIQNWAIGDGFGFPQSELEYFGALQMSGQILPHQLAEYYLITGGLHSGPLSAAKFTGIAGLVLYLVLAIMVFKGYSRLWKWLSHYPMLSGLRFPVGFFGTFAVYVPFKFIFVYGAYDKDIPVLIVSAGIYRLIASVVRREIGEQDDLMEAEATPVAG